MRLAGLQPTAVVDNSVPTIAQGRAMNDGTDGVALLGSSEPRLIARAARRVLSGSRLQTLPAANHTPHG